MFLSFSSKWVCDTLPNCPASFSTRFGDTRPIDASIPYSDEAYTDCDYFEWTDDAIGYIFLFWFISFFAGAFLFNAVFFAVRK